MCVLLFKIKIYYILYNRMNNLIRNEVNFGVSKENELFEEIKVFFKDDNLEKTKDRFNHFDFKSDKILIELKSRRNNKNKYPTTIIGLDKVEAGINNIKEGKKVYFVFNFTDEICYFELTEEYDYKVVSITRYDRNQTKLHIEIPIEDLLCLRKK